VANVRAAILAAGRGVRMGGSSPKTLLPVGEREPLLHYILAGLKKAGVEDLLVVTGFQPDAVQAYVTEHWGEATYVFNARYASWGNFHSVRVALDQSPGMDVMFVNSDIVVHPDVYGRVLGKRGDLVLAVQQRYTLDEEDMRVRLEGDRVRAIGKDLPKRLSQGEFAGVSLVRPAGALVYQDISSVLEWDARTHIYYEDVYGAMLDRIDTRFAPVNEGEYAEVDTPDDVRFASAVIERHADAWSAPQAQPA
jgi:choline kinase